MQKLSFSSVGRILDPKSRRKLFALALARIAANLLDLAGLAGIALLATTFGSLASGQSTISPVSLPLLGEFRITELQAVGLAGVVVLIFLMKSAFSVWLSVLTSLTVARVETEFARKLTAKYFSLESNALPEESSLSDFQTRVLSSTNGIGSFINGRITLIAEASLLTVMLAVFLAVNPIATISIVLFMGTVLAILNKLIGARIVRNGSRQIGGQELALQVSKDLFGVRRESYAAGVTNDWIDRLIKGKSESAHGFALMYSLHSLPRYVIETSLVLGIFAFIGGVVVFSDLQAQAVTIGVFLAGGLRVVASILPLQSAISLMKDGASRGSIAFSELLSNPSLLAKTKGSIDAGTQPKLEIRGVSYRFPGEESEMLSQINLRIPEFSKVAIVGPSGAGKTTLMDLMSGFKVPSAGEITLGSSSPREALLSAPGYFGLVPQRPHLVSASLLENISLAPADESDSERAKRALERAGLSYLVQENDWASVPVHPDSGSFSGGEIQRLGLARALYNEPKILFLDEATSALDAKTESEINSALDSLRAEMTIVLIAHRLSSVVTADKIIYLRDGKIVAEGTFSELKDSVPDFAEAVELMELGK